ncbi:MAG: hypothetical protein KGI69_03910 [Patescibacteria group bacterium]|nr:hypothetical protein [Patescibacteria group bacterium]
MKSIKEFFAKARERQARELAPREIIRKSLKAKAGVDVPVGAIGFKGDNAVVKGMSASARSAVFVKKAAILADIAAQGCPRKVSDIR